MKKRLLLILSLVMLLSLAGCKSSDDEKPFDYNENIMASMTASYINQFKDVTGDEAEYYMTKGTELESSLVKGFNQLESTDKVGAFVTIPGGGNAEQAKFKNGSSNDILCTVRCTYENRDVDVTVSFVKNLEYYKETAAFRRQLEAYCKDNQIDPDEAAKESGYESFDEFIDAQMLQQGIYPYTPVQGEVSAVYSKSELLKKAGANTAIGMSTVFCALIFISFIISLLKFVPMLFDPDRKKKAAAEVGKVVNKPEEIIPEKVAEPVIDNENLASDDELVAVITAALYAALSDESKTNAISKDKLVVRSIRRVR